MQYLTNEEQFKEVLNNEEISRIKDPELRKLRYEYWKKFTDAFEDEQNISDSEFVKLTERLSEEEKRDLDKYKINKGLV